MEWIGVPETSLTEIAKRMRDHDVGAIPVGENDRLIGMVTDRDIVLSDLFIVYTRGSNLPNRYNDGFGDLFHDALVDPVIDRFVIKLRYRFGL